MDGSLPFLHTSSWGIAAVVGKENGQEFFIIEANSSLWENARVLFKSPSGAQKLCTPI